MEDLLNISIR